jgi:hypothetical protein
MKSFKLGVHGKARVWIDEPAGARYVTTRVETRVVSGSQPTDERRASRRIAVELWLPRGARSEYGLLGGWFAGDASGRVTIDLGVSGATDERFLDSLGAATDDVRVGLPAEYANEVLTVAASLATENLRSGRLTIDEAAHGIVGSSRRLFGRLTWLVVRLLDDRIDLSDDVLLAIVRESEGQRQ